MKKIMENNNNVFLDNATYTVMVIEMVTQYGVVAIFYPATDVVAMCVVVSIQFLKRMLPKY